MHYYTQMLNNRIKKSFKSIDSLLVEPINEARKIFKCESESIVANCDDTCLNDDFLVSLIPKRIRLMSKSIESTQTIESDIKKHKKSKNIKILAKKIRKNRFKLKLKKHLNLIFKVKKEASDLLKPRNSKKHVCKQSVDLFNSILNEIIESIENFNKVQINEVDDFEESVNDNFLNSFENIQSLNEYICENEIKLSRAKINTIEHITGFYHETQLIIVNIDDNSNKKTCNNNKIFKKTKSKSCDNLIANEKKKNFNVIKFFSQKSIRHMNITDYINSFASCTQVNEEMYFENEKYFSNSTLEIMSSKDSIKDSFNYLLNDHESLGLVLNKSKSGLIAIETKQINDLEDETFTLLKQSCDSFPIVCKNCESPLYEQYGLPECNEIEIDNNTVNNAKNETSNLKTHEIQQTQTKTIEFKTENGLLIEVKVNFTQINDAKAEESNDSHLKIIFDIDLSQFPLIKSHNLTQTSHSNNTEIELLYEFDGDLTSIATNRENPTQIEETPTRDSMKNNEETQSLEKNNFENITEPVEDNEIKTINEASEERKPRPSYLIQKNCHIFGGCDEDEANDEFFLSSGAVYQSWPYIYEPGFALIPLIEEEDIIKVISKSDNYLYNNYLNEDSVCNDIDLNESSYSINELPEYSLNNYELNLIHTVDTKRKKKRKRKRRSRSNIQSLDSKGSSVNNFFDYNDNEYYSMSDSESETESLRAYKQRHALGFTNNQDTDTISMNRYIKNFCSNLNLPFKIGSNQEKLKSSSSINETGIRDYSANQKLSYNKQCNIDKTKYFLSEQCLDQMRPPSYISTNFLI